MAELESFRLVRRVANEDVRVFGKELSALHLDTPTAPLYEAMHADYERALDAYERAKARLPGATTGTDITAVTRTLADGRFAHACILAGRDDIPLPPDTSPASSPGTRPAHHHVEWAPPVGGAPRGIPVCFRDFERLTAARAWLMAPSGQSPARGTGEA